MKIALYTYSWPPGYAANGIVTYAAQLVPALRQLGHEVFVLTSNPVAETLDYHTIDLNRVRLSHPLRSRLKSRFFQDYIPFVEKLESAISELVEFHDLDVLEIEESFGWSLRISQRRIVPIVIRLHGPWFLNGSFGSINEAKHTERISSEGRAIGSATLITAPSANVLENVRAYYNLNLSLSRVIPNPFQVSKTVAEWQLSSCDPNRILYVGKFDTRKGGDLVLRAFAALAEHYPNLRLTFVGPDDGIPDQDGRVLFCDFVRKNLPECSRSRIDFHGELPNEAVMGLRSKHFLTIVASQFEILPYAVIEAMSAGCPIVASKVGGIPELINNRKNGLLFQSQHLDELVSACRTLLDNHELAASLGAQAREDCIQLLNAERIAMQTVAAYRDAIDAFEASRSSS